MTQSTIARYGYVAHFTGSEFRSPTAHQLPDKFPFVGVNYYNAYVRTKKMNPGLQWWCCKPG